MGLEIGNHITDPVTLARARVVRAECELAEAQHALKQIENVGVWKLDGVSGETLYRRR